MEQKKKLVKPLSPHIGIYKPQITSVLSILHRITGVALTFGLAMLSIFIIAAAYAPEQHALFAAFGSSVLGQIAIWGFVFSLYFHISTGIRHLFWDIGQGYEIKTVYKTGYFAVATAIVLTAITWKLGAGL